VEIEVLGIEVTPWLSPLGDDKVSTYRLVAGPPCREMFIQGEGGDISFVLFTVEGEVCVLRLDPDDTEDVYPHPWVQHVH
jgi:hypothetical protein